MQKTWLKHDVMVLMMICLLPLMAWILNLSVGGDPIKQTINSSGTVHFYFLMGCSFILSGFACYLSLSLFFSKQTPILLILGGFLLVQTIFKAVFLLASAQIIPAHPDHLKILTFLPTLGQTLSAITVTLLFVFLVIFPKRGFRHGSRMTLLKLGIGAVLVAFLTLLWLDKIEILLPYAANSFMNRPYQLIPLVLLTICNLIFFDSYSDRFGKALVAPLKQFIWLLIWGQIYLLLAASNYFDYFDFSYLVLEIFALSFLTFQLTKHLQHDHLAHEQLTGAYKKLRWQLKALEENGSNYLMNMNQAIQTPMAEIKGMTELLLTDELPAPLREKIRVIQNRSNTVQATINDVLFLARIETDNLDMATSPIDIRHLVKEALSQMEEAARQKDIVLDCHIQTEVPPLIQGDIIRLKQVLFHLINNAIRFTAAGSIQLDVLLAAQAGFYQTLQFKITDTGVGIPLERQKHLFSPFRNQRINQKSSARNGFGLAICKGLIERMGGEIAFSSEPGSGSCFSFCIKTDRRLPALPSKEKQIVAAVQNSLVGQASPKNILIIDNSSVSAIVMQNIFNKMGFKVDVIRDPSLARTFLSRKPYRFVFIQAPSKQMTQQFMQWFEQKFPSDQRPLLISLVRAEEQNTVEQLLAAGFDDILVKPVDAEKTYDCLLRCNQFS